MEERAHGEPPLGDLRHDRIDQEVAVVLHDLQPVEAYRARADRRGDADRRRAPAPSLAEPPEVGEVGGEVGGRKLGQLVRGRVGGGLGRKGLESGFRRIVGEHGERGPHERGIGRPAHRETLAANAVDIFRESLGADTRTPPEESVRRRVVPPWGGGGTLSARRVRGLGVRTLRSGRCGPRPTLHRNRKLKLKALGLRTLANPPDGH
jgi:hypothetical protein